MAAAADEADEANALANIEAESRNIEKAVKNAFNAFEDSDKDENGSYLSLLETLAGIFNRPNAKTLCRNISIECLEQLNRILGMIDSVASNGEINKNVRMLAIQTLIAFVDNGWCSRGYGNRDILGYESATVILQTMGDHLLKDELRAAIKAAQAQELKPMHKVRERVVI